MFCELEIGNISLSKSVCKNSLQTYKQGNSQAKSPNNKASPIINSKHGTILKGADQLSFIDTIRVTVNRTGWKWFYDRGMKMTWNEIRSF